MAKSEDDRPFNVVLILYGVLFIKIILVILFDEALSIELLYSENDTRIASKYC